MAGLDPAIHVGRRHTRDGFTLYGPGGRLSARGCVRVDGRVKPGQDGVSPLD
jgi:hypothetical protein